MAVPGLLKQIRSLHNKGACGFLILIDPDKVSVKNLKRLADSRALGFLVGGSLLTEGNLTETIVEIKKHSKKPVFLFPGHAIQVCTQADGILLPSLISGRNPEYLIGQHVHASLAIDRSGMEVIPTGYILTGGGGNISSTQYITQTLPIPDDKHELVLATALAGIQLGMELIYLEAGSGTDHPLSSSLVKTVSTKIRKPLLVGGGISEINTVRSFKKSGASILIIGNFLEKNIGFIDDLNKFFK